MTNIFAAFRDHAAHRAQRRLEETPPLFAETADVRRAAVARFRAANPDLFARPERDSGPSPSELAEKYRAAPVTLSEAAQRLFRSSQTVAEAKPDDLRSQGS